MATSGDIYTQLQTQYDPNNAAKTIEEGIRNANRGTIENLMRDATDQMGNAYGAFNNSFAEAGNSTARTMSPAQRLALAQSKTNQGMAGLNLNRGLRDFYRTSINDTIGKAMNAWDMGRNDLKDRYGMLLGREQYADQLKQQEWERQMAEKQLAASTRGNSFDWSKFLEDDGDPVADLPTTITTDTSNNNKSISNWDWAMDNKKQAFDALVTNPLKANITHAKQGINNKVGSLGDWFRNKF